MTPLLSQQLMQLPPATLPQEVATQRARLVRRLRPDTECGGLLGAWRKELEAERAAVTDGRPSPHERTEELKQRELLALKVVRSVAQLGRRLVVERPALDHYAELLSQLKSPAAYVPEPCPYEPFEPHTEDNDPDYASILSEAGKRALAKAERTFVYHESLFQRSLALLLGMVGILVGAAGRLHSWTEPSTGDALTLLGVNLLLGSGVIQLHIHRKKQATFREHLRGASTAEEAAARREIERRERARLNVFLENSRRRREAYDATDSERRGAFERLEAQRIEHVRRVISGQDVKGVMGALLPLSLPLPCPATWRALPDGRLEIQVLFPTEALLPPSIDGVSRLTRVPPTPMDRELEGQIMPLAAALAVRHLAELFFHLPTLRSGRVFVLRAVDALGQSRVPLVQVDADRRSVQGLRDVSDPLDLLRSLRSRVFYDNLGEAAGERAAS